MTWNLYERSEESSGIFDYTGSPLPPLTFTNGKTQEDVVQEIVHAINNKTKIIFVQGVCGTGKSAIALNVAKEVGRTSIVVPIKSLQEQYEQDYTKKKYILKDEKPLKIAVIKGRNNFPCRYDAGERADNMQLPCTIEIRDKNTPELLRFIGENPAAAVEDFSVTSDIRRMHVAPACPYWSPVMPADMNPKGLGEYKKIPYKAVSGQEYAVFQRKQGCPYYEQYHSYASADVLIFNAAKYLIENSMGRKPQTEVEIVDECDEFLDSFANERRLNLNRLLSALQNLNPEQQERRTAVKELISALNTLIYEGTREHDCVKVKTTDFYTICERILKAPNLAEDEEFNYYNTAVEVVRSFESIIDDTYLSIERISDTTKQDTLFGGMTKTKDDTVLVTLVSINLAEKFKELLATNKTFVMMSGTVHSREVLRDIFGLDNFMMIDAEVHNPGTVHKKRTGLERNCSYANFNNGNVTREQYLKILDNCIAQAARPTLVHVNAFSDLPTNAEKERLHLDHVMTQEAIKEEQQYAQQAITAFQEGTKAVLFTTKCARGVDFAGDICRSIIMTRYPYPNISSLFWKILKKEKPHLFMEFYLDKAKRELIQKVARGVRFKGDWVELLSPDSRVFNQKFD